MDRESGLLIKNVQIVTGDGVIDNAAAGIKDGAIVFVGKDKVTLEKDYNQVIDGGGKYLSPGLIDSHTHGGIGFDFLTTDSDETELLLKWYASNGVTSVFPTLSAGLKPDFIASCKRLESFKKNSSWGDHIAGVHIEGPYINEARKGAQPYDEENPISPDDLDDYLAYFVDSIRVMTIAPEIEGGMKLLQQLVGKGVICSIGHSAATYEETLEAVKAGLSRTTHTFNGMNPFHHRKPGIVGAAMVSDSLCSEITLDGNHVHPGAVKALLRAKGIDTVVLITDSMQAAGLGDGEFVRPGNRKIHVENGVARLESGSIAGSVLTLNRAVLNAIRLLDLPLHAAVNMATKNVATSLGMKEVGQILEGFTADLCIHDDEMEVSHTLKNGKLVYSNQ